MHCFGNRGGVYRLMMFPLETLGVLREITCQQAGATLQVGVDNTYSRQINETCSLLCKVLFYINPFVYTAYVKKAYQHL